MKEIVNSLYGVLIKPGRRVGNTTRIADNAIQLLFSGKIVRVVDHVHNKITEDYLLEQILNTLELIHGLDPVKHISITRSHIPDEKCNLLVNLVVIDEKGNYIRK